MSEKDFASGMSEAKEMAKQLCHRLHQYQEAIRDPDATASIPDIKHMCDLADTLRKMLNEMYENNTSQ